MDRPFNLHTVVWWPFTSTFIPLSTIHSTPLLRNASASVAPQVCLPITELIRLSLTPTSSDAIWALLNEYNSNKTGVVLAFATQCVASLYSGLLIVGTEFLFASGIDFPKMIYDHFQLEASRKENTSSTSTPAIEADSPSPTASPNPKVLKIEGIPARIPVADPSLWRKIAATDSVFFSAPARRGAASPQAGALGSNGCSSSPCPPSVLQRTAPVFSAPSSSFTAAGSRGCPPSGTVPRTVHPPTHRASGDATRRRGEGAPTFSK